MSLSALKMMVSIVVLALLGGRANACVGMTCSFEYTLEPDDPAKRCEHIVPALSLQNKLWTCCHVCPLSGHKPFHLRIPQQQLE